VVLSPIDRKFKLLGGPVNAPTENINKAHFRGGIYDDGSSSFVPVGANGCSGDTCFEPWLQMWIGVLLNLRLDEYIFQGILLSIV